MNLKHYIIYGCYPSLGIWIGEEYFATSFEQAYALDSERKAKALEEARWESRAGELFHGGVQKTGAWFRERASDLIELGNPFPEGFHPDKTNVAAVSAAARKFKMPEVCPEIHCTQDRSKIDFSKITADMAKAQFGSKK